MMNRHLRLRSTALAASLIAVALTVGTADAAPGPAQIGSWGAPFVEGGFGTPQCTSQANGELVCKPTAVSIAQLASGKILYWNGIEGTENIQFTAYPEGGRVLRDSQARILDLTGSAPGWSKPSPERGVGGNDAPYRS